MPTCFDKKRLQVVALRVDCLLQESLRFLCVSNKQAEGATDMKFGKKIRELRRNRKLSQRELAVMVDVTFTYISKIENHKLDFGDHPSEDMIVKLAEALEVDVDMLLVLAEKVPPLIKQRVIERPEAFRAIATLDDKALDKLVAQAKKRKPR